MIESPAPDLVARPKGKLGESRLKPQGRMLCDGGTFSAVWCFVDTIENILGGSSQHVGNNPIVVDRFTLLIPLVTRDVCHLGCMRCAIIEHVEE